MITRMDNLERNMNELKELKNTTWEIHEACRSFNSRIDQAEERILEVKDQLNEIKREGKIREKAQKGLIRLTFGGHHSGTKIAEEESGSNPHGSAAATGVPRAGRAWSGPQQSCSSGARLLEGKLRNRNTSSSTIWTSTQRPNRKVSNYTDDQRTNPQKWEETSAKRRKTPETRTPRLLERTKTPHQQGNKAGQRMTVTKWRN